MVYRRSRINVRKPKPRARRTVRSRSSYSRSRPYRRSATRSRSKAPCHCPGDLSASSKWALAQLDPFHPMAAGAKVPDTNTMPSVANSSTDQVSCPLATTGFLTGFAFRPMYNSAVISATPASASAVTWGATLTTNASDRRDLTAFAAQFEAVRPTAHAVRLVSQLSPTSATGFVHIGLSVESQFGSPAGPTWSFPTTVNDMTGLSHYKRVTLASLTQSPLTVINKWIDERGFQYQDASQIAALSPTAPNESSNAFGTDWCTIVVLVEGAPATPSPLSAEHLLLTEAIPKKNSVLFGTQAAANSPGTMSAVSSMIGSTDFGHTEVQQDSFINQGLQNLSEGAAVAGRQVWDQVAQPLLQRLGGAAVNTAAQYAYNAAFGMGGLPGVNSNPSRLALTR